MTRVLQLTANLKTRFEADIRH